MTVTVIAIISKNTSMLSKQDFLICAPTTGWKTASVTKRDSEPAVEKTNGGFQNIWILELTASDKKILGRFSLT